MQDQFIVSHNGYEMAPLKAYEVLAKLAAKELEPVDYIFIEEKKDWIMLAEFQAYINETVPQSASIPEKPPALHSPYPVVSNEKKDQLRQQAMDEVTELRRKAQLANAHVETESAETADSDPKVEPLRLKQGEAVYSLPSEKAGHLILKIKSANGIPSGENLEVKVKSGKPEQISWEGPQRKTVGEELRYQVFAKDSFGNVVKSYSGEMSLKWSGKLEAPEKLKFNAGLGEILITTTLAQEIQFEILATNDLPDLKLPSAARIHFEAGPAEKLVLEGPSEVTAGEAIQVKIKALDKYGNLAKLDADVEVEVSNKTA